MLAGGVPAPRAAATERIVTDRNTGLALYGIDPVAYFTDGKPVTGKPDFEYRYAGAIWRFDNEGNRAVFEADPDIYMPRFGGYDPVSVARGLATPGYPALWAVHDQRLYLFYTAKARESFMKNPNAAIAGAAARWSTVQSQLAD
jgi:YHS domain-containing protein